MSNDLLEHIQNMSSGFSKGQRMIAQYIIHHYDKATFMTASKLGATVGVSESTVVRFASELGYEGYPQLQKALQELIRNRLTSVQRMELSNEQLGNNDILQKVLTMDIDKIRRTLEETSHADFGAAVDTINQARTIYIMGIRSSEALSDFLYYYFKLIFENVRLIGKTSASELFEQLLRIDERDVIIGISFPRYSARTVKAMKYAKDCGAKVVAITDSLRSPLTPFADHTLVAQSAMTSFVDSLVAPLSLINALIAAVGRKRSKEVFETFQKLESIWDRYQVYQKNNSNDAGVVGDDARDV